VYTWFKSPVSDDDDLLCYEGVIDNKKVLFIDCFFMISQSIGKQIRRLIRICAFLNETAK